MPKPFKQESAIEEAINSIALIASSLPGITISTFSGFTLESARSITGIFNLLASVSADVSTGHFEVYDYKDDQENNTYQVKLLQILSFQMLCQNL